MISFEYYISNKSYIILLLILFNIFINSNNNYEINNPTNVPELLYYNNQTIQLLTQSNKCHLTLFFLSEFSEYNVSEKTKKINLKDKNYFITFYEKDNVYDQYVELLEKHGLIKSNFKYGKNNLFITPMNRNPSFPNRSNDYDLGKYQKVYKYLNAHNIFQKDTLNKCYSSMKKLFYEDFNFLPETYNYPEQKLFIIKKFKNYKLSLSELWLVKPSNSGGGHNISVLDKLENIKLKEFVISKYIKNINLINGKKYDLRLYALISGLKPLRIYFYKEGFVRIASEKFSLNMSSLENKYIHLTNICINRFHKNYIRPDNSNDENANMWSISMYKSYLKTYNVEWEDIRQKIKDIIIKSIISVYNNLIEENDKHNLKDQIFYDLLGFDILITDDFIPKLIEINYTPTMEMFNNLEKKIKTNLFVETLNLIGIVPYSRKTEEPLLNKFKFMNDIDDNINNALCELARPRGDYDLIFPTKENINIYKKYFINNTQENKKFWNKINRLR